MTLKHDMAVWLDSVIGEGPEDMEVDHIRRVGGVAWEIRVEGSIFTIRLSEKR